MFLLILFFSLANCDRSRNHVQIRHGYQHTNSCNGLLPWTCHCNPPILDESNGINSLRVTEITCLHSRLPDAKILNSLQKFENVQSASFHGNNFLKLPERFSGTGQHVALQYLNLSGNHFSHIHKDAFIGLPALQSLDLSNNQIHLRQDSGDWAFLKPMRFLRRLILRKAFKHSHKNASSQLMILELGLKHARLDDLQILDLSRNGFDRFPPKLVCWTKSLTHLILSHNRLQTLYFDDKCEFKELRVIDLTSNRFMYFTSHFARTAYNLPDMSIQVNENPFDCTGSNCASQHSMVWFQSASTNKIRDKENVQCRSDKKSDSLDGNLLNAAIGDQLQCKEFDIAADHIPWEKASEKETGKHDEQQSIEVINFEESTSLDPVNKTMTSGANFIDFTFSSISQVVLYVTFIVNCWSTVLL